MNIGHQNRFQCDLTNCNNKRLRGLKTVQIKVLSFHTNFHRISEASICREDNGKTQCIKAHNSLTCSVMTEFKP